MSNFSRKILFNFIVILLLQIFVFNNIVIEGKYIPFVYILFIITLPHDINKLFLIIFAFIIGTTQDIFSATIGIHSFSTVLVAYVRSAILSAYTPPSWYNQDQFLEIKTFGFGWFFKYSFTIILIHSFSLYLIDYFNLSLIIDILQHSFFSSIITTLFIFPLQYGLFEKFK